MVDFDAAREEKVLEFARRQRVADAHQHHEADHLRRGVEIAKRVRQLGHGPGLAAGRLPPRDFGLTTPYPELAYCTGCITPGTQPTP